MLRKSQESGVFFPAVVHAVLGLVCSVSSANAAEDKIAIPEEINSILSNHCLECHDADVAENDIRLDNFDHLESGEQYDLFNKIEEQIYLRQMPPKKKPQLSEGEWTQALEWVKTGYGKLGERSKFKAKLRDPKYGNFVDHDKLFSREIDEKAFTPARRWLISPYIFSQRINEFYEMDERTIKGHQIRSFIKNPFLLSVSNAVHYYDSEPLSEGHLNTIIANGSWIAGKQLEDVRIRIGETTAKRIFMGGTRYGEEWYPPTDGVFEAVITSEGVGGDPLLIAAITKQFELVLRRTPTDSEIADYLAFIKANIAIGGKSKGLQEMLLAIWMEEGVYYRSEFGAGPADEFGRKMLAPMEAAYAIAYALTDASPDEFLVAAAKEGRLNTRADFSREILRMLADTAKDYPVDENLYHYRYSSPHPRLLRFFRDFFGYPKAKALFKDQNRYWGHDYRHVATEVIREADQLVEFFINQDTNVIENLLTSDRYYVYHDGDNEKTVNKVKGLQKHYEDLYAKTRGIDWEKDPLKVFVENGLIQTSDNEGHNKKRANDLGFRIKIAEESVGKGNRPIPFNRFETTLRGPHLYVYNIDDHDWDYEPEQPFSLPNRRGILTHPAWLIAHSKNTATDPILRGHWIRESLLAGTIPDIPISVDAVIPEDPHKTLRSRLDSVTTAAECWRCHQYMNPLGLPFEMYDDFGRFRTDEALEYPENVIKEGTEKPNVPNTYKTLPVETRGALVGTGNPELDGEVTDAIDLIERIGKSDRARQSVIRHAFRYFMGRNEMLSDSQTLIDADRVYLETGGSFKAVVVSLLTSDSFIYRKALVD